MPRSPKLHGPQTDLHRAIERGDLAAVRAWIAAGKPLEDRDPTAMTPLALAAYFERSTIFQELLNAGASTIPTDDGNHVLFYAAWRGNRKMVQALLDRQIDVNFRSDAGGNSGQTALIGAAKGGHLKITEVLYSHHADTAAKDFQGKTALDIADENGHEEVVHFLKAFGAPGRRSPKRPAKPHPGEQLLTDARAAIKKFPAAATQPAFEQFLALLATAAGKKPKTFANPDASEFRRLRGVYTVALPGNRVSDLRSQADSIGATLLEEDPLNDGESSVPCVVLPTADPVVVAVARETSSNGVVEADPEEILAFLADLGVTNPFVMTTCTADTIAGTFRGPVRRPRTVAKRLLAVCPGDDEHEENSVAETLKQEGRFFLWWD